MISTNAVAGSASGVSLARLYVLRAMYLLNLILLGSDVWPGIISSAKVCDPTPGVAISFWAALSALSCLCLRDPLAMLPLLFLQLSYKAVWLLAIARPLHFAGSAKEMTTVFIVGLVFDVLVIPWPFVWSQYVKARGDRWTWPFVVLRSPRVLSMERGGIATSCSCRRFAPPLMLRVGPVADDAAEEHHVLVHREMTGRVA